MTADQTPTPPAARMTDSEYLLELIDETFSTVPEVKAHHERMRRIAAVLAHTQQPAAAKAKAVAVAVAWCDPRDLEDGVEDFMVGQKHGFPYRYTMPLYTAPLQEAERQPLTDSQLWASWLRRRFPEEGEDDSMEAQIVAYGRAIERFHQIGITVPATQETAK